MIASCFKASEAESKAGPNVWARLPFHSPDMEKMGNPRVRRYRSMQRSMIEKESSEAVGKEAVEPDAGGVEAVEPTPARTPAEDPEPDAAKVEASPEADEGDGGGDVHPKVPKISLYIRKPPEKEQEYAEGDTLPRTAAMKRWNEMFNSMVEGHGVYTQKSTTDLFRLMEMFVEEIISTYNFRVFGGVFKRSYRKPRFHQSPRGRFRDEDEKDNSAACVTYVDGHHITSFRKTLEEPIKATIMSDPSAEKGYVCGYRNNKGEFVADEGYDQFIDLYLERKGP